MTWQTSCSWVYQYTKAIERGEIVVGFEIKQMLEKLNLEMFDTEYQEAHNIQIDYEASEKHIRFIETQCKHFEAPFAGKPFLLELFQEAFIEAIFAIKIYDDELQRHVRKYKNILFLVGRKNGKTPLIAAICLSEWFCGPMGLKVLCGSNDYDQAALMHEAINAMREESPVLEKCTRKNVKGIFFGNPKQKKKKGKFTQQNKGTIKKISAKSGAKEGRNIGIGAIDEVFEMADDKLVMPVRQALSTQDEPLYFELTTEGFTNGGYLDERLIEARKVLNGEEENERWLIWLYTQDNEREVWENEASWAKSNPGLGAIKKVSFLREMIEEAKGSTSRRAFVLAKDFNIKQSSAAPWLSEEVIKNNLKFDIEDIYGLVGIGAVDLSETGDLTNARAMFMNPVTKMKYFISMYFLPASHIDDNPKYREWVEKGYMFPCDGNEVSDEDVINFFESLVKRYKVKFFKVGYDKWQARGFKNAMEADGFELERINQGEALSNAISLLENDLKSGLVNYNQNPVDEWCLKNIAAPWNSKGTRRQPVKVQGDKTKKIDGGVTMLICYETLDRYRGEYMEIIRSYK